MNDGGKGEQGKKESVPKKIFMFEKIPKILKAAAD